MKNASMRYKHVASIKNTSFSLKQQCISTVVRIQWLGIFEAKGEEGPHDGKSLQAQAMVTPLYSKSNGKIFH
jgi:hypothetical protein